MPLSCERNLVFVQGQANSNKDVGRLVIGGENEVRTNGAEATFAHDARLSRAHGMNAEPEAMSPQESVGPCLRNATTEESEQVALDHRGKAEGFQRPCSKVGRSVASRQGRGVLYVGMSECWVKQEERCYGISLLLGGQFRLSPKVITPRLPLLFKEWRRRTECALRLVSLVRGAPSTHSANWSLEKPRVMRNRS